VWQSIGNSEWIATTEYSLAKLEVRKDRERGKEKIAEVTYHGTLLVKIWQKEKKSVDFLKGGW